MGLIREFMRAKDAGLDTAAAMQLAESIDADRRKATIPARQPAVSADLRESLDDWARRHQAAENPPPASDLVSHRRLLTVRRLDTVADVLAESREPSRERSTSEDLQAWRRSHRTAR